MEVRDRHAQRREDVRVGVLGQRRARRAFDRQREHGVPGVGIQVLVAGKEVQRLLPRDDAQDGLVVEGVFVAPAGEDHERVDVAQAARVVQEMPDGDGPAVVRQLRHVLPHIVIGSEFPLLDGEGGRHCRELLGDRAGVEHRAGRDGRIVLEVRHPVAAGVQGAAVLVDAERAPGRSGPIPLREDRVDLRGPGRALRSGRPGLEQPGTDTDERGTGRAPARVPTLTGASLRGTSPVSGCRGARSPTSR